MKLHQFSSQSTPSDKFSRELIMVRNNEKYLKIIHSPFLIQFDLLRKRINYYNGKSVKNIQTILAVHSISCINYPFGFQIYYYKASIKMIIL